MFIGIILVVAFFVAKYFGYNINCLKYLLHKKQTYPIESSCFGMNNFFNVPECGNILKQYKLLQDANISVIRILFAWTDGVQQNETSNIDFSFYDDIVNNCPDGIYLVPVVAHTPSWFLKSNKHNLSPVDVWIDSWFIPIVRRYKGKKQILGYEVWNEPDASVSFSDAIMCLESPENYINLLQKASSVVTKEDPNKLLIMAATFSIQQHYPRSLEYNKKLKALGAQNYTDVWNIHLYGENFVDLFKTKGVLSFLETITIPIWITEMGCRGQKKQKEYFEQTYSFLHKYIKPEKVFYYIFTDVGFSNETYGLITSGGDVSPLYKFLVERPK